MRFCKHHKTVAVTETSMPFDGLGFSMRAVEAMAETMSVVRGQAGREGGRVPVLDGVWQPCGYSLLVALGREIRGR